MRDQHDASIENCLGQLASGDDSARRVVIELASERLYRLTRAMFHQFPALRNWEETPDIHQRAMLKLYQALGDVRPENPRQLFNLAALQVKRILLDLARHYSPPPDGGQRHPVPASQSADADAIIQNKPMDESLQPGNLDHWTMFHEKISGLPDAEREVTMLLFYDGLGQSEVAELMQVSIRTVKRLWQSAKMLLRQSMEHPDAT
jgi:RNA polymerase sigma-70 factor (ECF subfamily)